MKSGLALKSHKTSTPNSALLEQDSSSHGCWEWPWKTLQFLLYTQQVCGALRWLRTQLKTGSCMWRPPCESCWSMLCSWWTSVSVSSIISHRHYFCVQHEGNDVRFYYESSLLCCKCYIYCMGAHSSKKLSLMYRIDAAQRSKITDQC